MFRRLRGRLNQLQGQANQTMGQAQTLINLAQDLVEDISDGFAVNLVIPPGSVQQFLQDITSGKGGKLPIQIQVDPTVDTAKDD